MFYPNLLNLRNVDYKIIDFNSFSSGLNTDVDESVMPIRYAKLTYNFDYKEGNLKPGIGISVPTIRYSANNTALRKSFNFPAGYEVKGCWLFNAWHQDANLFFPLIVIYCSDDKMYYNYLYGSQTNMIEMQGLVFTEKPKVITYNLNGVDTLIAVSNADGMYTWTENDGVKKIDNAPKISSMCLHYERLFVTTKDNPRRIWFSDDLNPTNFNVSSQEGGFIDIIDDFGRSNKVISFNDYVYVFRDYNIARLTAFAEQEQFAIEQLYVGNGKIYSDTVALCGDKIMYLASDGLYQFNGSSSNKINLGINNFFKNVDNNFACAGYSDGCYYLACKINFDDEKVGCENKDNYKNNALIKIDVSTGELNILRGYDIKDICVINDILGSEVFCIVNNGVKDVLGKIDMSGAFFDNATSKVWKSPKVDLGYPKNDKLICEAYINSKHDCVVEFVADNKTKKYLIKGSDRVTTLKPYIRGKKVAINFISNIKDVCIESPQIKVGIL